MLSPTTLADAIALVLYLPDKQCSSEPWPTWLLKENIDLVAPFLRHLLNLSLEHGAVPSVFESAYVTPLLKKTDLDPTDAKSYRPISKMSITSKRFERVVSEQLVKHLKDIDLLPDLKSVYRANHSTETAALKVLADLLLALDSGDLAMLILLDLSAAFDSIDHDTFLLWRLLISYGLDGVLINWFSSYLQGRSSMSLFRDPAYSRL